jgi:hypothetical protein
VFTIDLRIDQQTGARDMLLYGAHADSEISCDLAVAQSVYAMHEEDFPAPWRQKSDRTFDSPQPLPDVHDIIRRRAFAGRVGKHRTFGCVSLAGSLAAVVVDGEISSRREEQALPISHLVFRGVPQYAQIRFLDDVLGIVPIRDARPNKSS